MINTSRTSASSFRGRLGAVTLAVSAVLLVGCGSSDGDSASVTELTDVAATEDTVAAATGTPTDDVPAGLEACINAIGDGFLPLSMSLGGDGGDEDWQEAKAPCTAADAQLALDGLPPENQLDDYIQDRLSALAILAETVARYAEDPGAQPEYSKEELADALIFDADAWTAKALAELDKAAA